LSEEGIKQRLNRAIKSAIRCLDNPKGSYQIILLNNGPFHIEAIREKEIRKIRVVLDKIGTADEKIIQEFKLPLICTKEIWCKKHNERGFKRIEL
jgi:hypothetical protein